MTDLSKFFGNDGEQVLARRPFPVAPPLPPKAEPIALLDPRAMANYQSYAEDVREICHAATTKPLAGRDEAATLSELLAKAKTAEKGLDVLRRSAVDPLNAKVKAINAMFRPVTDALAGLDERGKKLLLAFTQAERSRIQREEAEARRRQEEAALAEANATAAAEAAETPEERSEALALAEAASQRQMVAQVEAPLPAPRGVRTDSGTSSIKARWIFTVENAAQLPRMYLVPDEKAIRAAVAAGVRNIPGVAIYEEEGITVRTAQ